MAKAKLYQIGEWGQGTGGLSKTGGDFLELGAGGAGGAGEKYFFFLALYPDVDAPEP
ncbi:hypothetical protein [Tolypothrix sp. VBCCA 56010]|uniref:hypothetical protein n=1 Tax=Tolypothrix sp. VBCCA 56010 TaxID=3137731 RepID=UPI003D7E4167